MKRGDFKGGLIEAYKSHADAIFRYCYFKTNDRELAKDIVQQVFLKTLKYINNGNEVEDFKLFLFKSANNMVIDWYRKQKPVSLEEIYEKGFDFIDPQIDASDYAEVEQAMRIIGKLSAEDQSLIIWRFVEELSLGEISTILDEKENNVSVKIHRALKRLRKLLK